MAESGRNPIPDELLRFIEANIGSVEQIEILRILGETPESLRGVSELARACQVQDSAALEHLVGLKERGLLRMQSLPAPLVSYGTDTAEKEDMLDRLLRCYKERPVTLIRQIYRNRRSS